MLTKTINAAILPSFVFVIVIKNYLIFSLLTALLATASPAGSNLQGEVGHGSHDTGQTGAAALRTALLTELHAAENLDGMPIRLHPGTSHRRDSQATVAEERHCKSVVYNTLQSLPEEHINGLNNLTLYYTYDGRRGLGGGDTIVLRCKNVSDEELTAVLVHEIGHIVDTGLIHESDKTEKSGFVDFELPVYESDQSVKFYEISWLDSATRLETARRTDFCSGYGMSDPFEDFAECYLLYRTHGSLFQYYAKHSLAMKAKYQFMKTYVFDNQEFTSQESLIKTPFVRAYDNTLIKYNLQAFLDTDQ